MNIMQTYDTLNADETNCIEGALDAFRDFCKSELGLKLANDDRAAYAAEALAKYLVESKRQ